MHLFRNRLLSKAIRDILLQAVSLGVSEEGKLIIEEYIEYFEFGLAFDHIIYELNEKGIKITKEYYLEIKRVGDLIQLDESEYYPRLVKLLREQ